jgi:cellulose synthase/poly-beta-1,6-N-acetylglucosamine synthase-like glycosyltransferase
MAGVHATRAPYLFPLDADDMAAPGALAALADALDANPDAAAAWGDEVTFGRTELRVRSPDGIDPWLLTYVNEIPVIALMRRDALLASGGWQVRSGYEDWDLWMTLAERGHAGVHVPRVVARHRLHDSRRGQANRADHEAIYAELRGRHPALFAQRRANWGRSRAPLRARLLLPLVGRRHRAAHLVMHPLRLLRVRRSRA